MNLQKLYDRSQQYRTILLLLCIFYMMFLAPLQLARVKKEQMFGISLNIGLKKTWVLLVICAAVLLGLRYLMDSNQISFVVSTTGFSIQCCQKGFGLIDPSSNWTLLSQVSLPALERAD